MIELLKIKPEFLIILFPRNEIRQLHTFFKYLALENWSQNGIILHNVLKVTRRCYNSSLREKYATLLQK